MNTFTDLPRSPVSLDELATIQQSALFSDEDIALLRRSRAILAPHVEEILDVWYGFVGANAHLLRSFTDPRTGAPIPEYLAGVRKRFAAWILDTADATHDQAWLDRQHAIGVRHHRTGKNRTDGAPAVDHVPFRDLFALVFPITFTLRPFLARGGDAPDVVDRMYQAWLKSCLVQVTLWSHPYVRAGDF